MKQSIILITLIGSILSACGGTEPSPPTAPEKPQAKATPAVNPAIDYTDPIELKKPTLNIAELVKASGLREVERVKRDDVVVHLLTPGGVPPVQIDERAERISVGWWNYNDEAKFKEINVIHNKAARRMVAALTGSVEPFDKALRCESAASDFLNGQKISVSVICKNGQLSSAIVSAYR